MHKFDETYEKWRAMLLNANIYLFISITIIEIFMYFLLKHFELIDIPLKEYKFHYLLIPTTVNSFILIMGYIILKYMKPNNEYINYIPPVQLAFICMIVASVHSTFSATLCVFCIPLFTTVIFCDRKITRRIGVFCLILLVISLFLKKYSMQNRFDDIYFFTEVIVALAILTATFFVCQVLITFQMEKSNLIKKAYLRQLELKEQLTKDQKTGLYGHTAFMNKLDQMVKSSENNNTPIALAIIDIDNFKKINDSYGHLKGDQVISRLVKLLNNEAKENHFISRFGGEEFTIIFNNTTSDIAYNFLDMLRSKFQKEIYNFTNDKITISVGLALWKKGLTSESLFNNADSAMYKSKHKGKNKIQVYDEIKFTVDDYS